MFNKKNLLATSLLAMLALTGCATSNANSTADSKVMPKDHYHAHGKYEKDAKNPHHDMNPHKHMDMMAHHHFDKLDLSDAQKKQLADLKEQNKAKIEKLHASLAEQEKNIKKQKEANASSATLLKLYQQKQATVDEMTELHKNAQKQFFAILTPEQQLKMYEGHKQKEMHKHHPHMDKHHHPHMEMKKFDKDMPKPDLPKPVK